MPVVFLEHAGTHQRKAQPKNDGHWKKLSPSTFEDMMGGVDGDGIVVDVDDQSPMILRAF